MSVPDSSSQVSPTLRSLDATSCTDKTEKPCDIYAGGEYPKGLTLVLISMALCFSIIIGGLDNSMTPTAIPRITDEFGSINDVGWYGSAWLVYGRLYCIFPVKWIYAGAIGTFELGCLICATAPTSNAFIIGRAILGLGNAGLITGTSVIVSRIVPLHRRPLYIAANDIIFATVSVVGPLLGGVFTDKVSWRWTFYVNLPIGAVALFTILISFNSPDVNCKSKSVSLRDCIRLFGPLVIFILGIVSLLLALRWGGSKYPWNSGWIIALVIVFGVLISIFVALQIWKQDRATIPPRIFMQRSMLAGGAYSLCIDASRNILTYFLPIYFQAIKGVPATKSAIYGLPLILARIPGAIICGALVTALGYYTPFVILSSILLGIGVGLLSTLTLNTRPDHWIGFQALYGLGYGIGLQQPILAVQTVLSRDDIPVGIALIGFLHTLGGALFISVGQNVFTNHLRAGLVSGVPGINPDIVLSAGAKSLRSAVDPQFLPAVLSVYNDALVSAIHVSLGVACVSIVGGLFMEWKSVKGRKDLEVKGA
ncbi:major facilitator superfamily domain-containing protein [Mycena albidolilacea]|uniref:Major facilitator superfamily domain-containing protein n=1 Tax=Mycena albidolilacea TaxID=1033008 RepID=A0AAD6ZCP8_9AGAR|nr:major facilitator superfamily domain-containing protein [Mycena albidolilacea]